MLLLAAAVWLAAADAEGNALVDGARAAYAALDYGACRAQAAASLDKPANRAARVEAHKLGGLCAAALGDVDGARASFTQMLILDHDATLPEGLSPRFTSAFREAKGALLDRPPLGFTVDSDVKEGRVRVVRVTIVDPDDQIAKVGFTGEGGVPSPPVRKAPRLELELPGEGAVQIYGYDKAGGEVAVLSLAPPGAAADEATQGDDPATPMEQPRDDDLDWLLWTAAGTGALVVVGGAVAAGVVLALQPPSRVGFTSAVVFGDE